MNLPSQAHSPELPEIQACTCFFQPQPSGHTRTQEGSERSGQEGSPTVSSSVPVIPLQALPLRVEAMIGHSALWGRGTGALNYFVPESSVLV